MKIKMWAGLIGGDPRVIRTTKEQALKGAREWRITYRADTDFSKIPVHAVEVDVEI